MLTHLAAHLLNQRTQLLLLKSKRELLFRSFDFFTAPSRKWINIARRASDARERVPVGLVNSRCPL